MLFSYFCQKLCTKVTFFAFVITAFYSPFSIADSFWTSVAYTDEVRLQQNQPDLANSCVPMSVLYSFKYGSELLRQVYNHVPGATDLEKLDQVYELSKATPSLTTLPSMPNALPSPILERSRGTYTFDFENLTDTVAESVGIQEPIEYVRYDIFRQPDEKRIGDFVARIHSIFKNSIAKGYPVIIAIDWRYLDTHSHTWKFVQSHVVTVLSVQSDLEPGQLSMTFKYYDPLTGGVHQASLFEETRSGFNAPLFELDSHRGIVGVWSASEERYKNENGVTNPYLVLSAPEFVNSQQMGYQYRQNISVYSILAHR